MRIKFLVDLNITGAQKALSQDLVYQVGQVLSNMINREFQDPKNGLMLHVKSIKEAPQVNVPAEVIPPREPPIAPPIRSHELRSDAQYVRRMQIDKRRRQDGRGPLFDPRTGRRLIPNG